MNQDQVINLIQTAGKIGGGIMAGYGAEASSLWTAIIGLLIAAVSFYFSHRSNATPAAPRATSSIVGALLLGTCLAGLAAGCTTNPSKSHVIRAVATGTKFGITQNPTTGVYELGVQRIQTEIVTIPVFFTNNIWAIPDVVSRYEVSTHSAVFGNAALTSTMATGTNAVGTQVGGTTPPINAGVGTGSNLTPLSH